MPIRVVTKDVRYIHELSLTLENSMPISSPAALGLTGQSLPPSLTLAKDLVMMFQNYLRTFLQKFISFLC